MNDQNENSGTMPFLEHFRELRRRLAIIFIAIFVSLLICFNFADLFYKFLSVPILEALPQNNNKLVFLDPIEPFFVYIKLSLLAAFIVSSPLTFYQVWRFIAPALYRNEKRWIIPAVAFSSLFFLLGVAFCYQIVLPLGLKALISFGLDSSLELAPQISMAYYYSLIIKLMLACGLIFEIPIFSIILARLGIIQRKSLTKHWRVAVIIIFVLAAVLTPPDPVSQMLLAIPMLILYALSILIVGVIEKKEIKSV